MKNVTIIKILVCMITLLAIVCYSCNSNKSDMTENEIQLINGASADTAFYVLQTTDEADSLFLRKRAIDLNVENIKADKNLQLLIARMKVTLDKEEGVGLAAPQIGISRNLFLFLRIDKPDLPIQVAINPKIVNAPEEMIRFEGDGCLSIPDVSGNTYRFPWVDVEYYDEKGELHKERLTGHSREDDFTGIIFQHEYDHLEGVLFVDRLCEEDAE